MNARIKILFAGGLVLLLCSFGFAYSGGSGTQADPYQIGTVADWNDLMHTSSDWDANFVMVADVNLQGLPLTPVGDRYVGGGHGTPFSGNFNGNNHIVSNPEIPVTLNPSAGLFGYTYLQAQIHDRDQRASINVIADYPGPWGSPRIGGLIGTNHGTVSNCFVTGTMDINLPYLDISSVGGLAGYSDGTITGSHSTCVIDVNARIMYGTGGLVGRNLGKIIACYSKGSVTGGSVSGNNTLGGLVGQNTQNRGYNTGDPIGSIERSFSEASVTAYAGSAGGLVGYTDIRAISLDCSITDCYAIGAVTGRGAAGLVGFSWYLPHFRNCYAAGPVTATAIDGGYGFCGTHYSLPLRPNIDCFWDIETSGQASPLFFALGKTTAEMKTLSTFTSAGWDFVGETINGPNDIWFIREGQYPQLVWENNKPIADAGSDQTVYASTNGMTQVKLDGSASNDADDDELTYQWRWILDGTAFIADGVSPTFELPIGVCTIDLLVTDGVADSYDDVNVTVVAPLECKIKVTPQAINRRSNQPYIQAAIQLPDGISQTDIDTSELFVICPGKIKAARQSISATDITADFDKAALMAEVPNGDIAINVAGRLKSGKYFFGTDTVKVFDQKSK